RVPLGSSVGDPSLDQAYVLVGKTTDVGEFPVSGDRLPRRHLPELDGLQDVVESLVGIAVDAERKRRDLTRAVTGLAVSLEDPDGLVVEGDAAVAAVGPSGCARAGAAGGG